LNTQAARISRKATSVALKCSMSKELIDDLEKTIDKLDLEADNSLNKVQEKNIGVLLPSTDCVPLPSTDCATDVLTGKISFKVPLVVKGPKTKRGIISLEKNKGKKKKSATKKGTDSSLILYYFCHSMIV
jgi:hypothetical protein